MAFEAIFSVKSCRIGRCGAVPVFVYLMQKLVREEYIGMTYF
jgi:hypothetical protein